ncbi:unnamed protein product [Plutella xylostella]|uniref:Protein Wnt n=1 Tax=Plutella xylostella TaxID=51655 RepID=A0A8S4F0Z0_PLUXY|nr:unnamed protein product [Plutella xylostella]
MKKQQRCRDGYCRMQQTFPATVILVFSLFCSASCHDNTMPSLHLNSMLTCRLVGGLTREQRAVCHEAPDAAAIAFEGLDLAVRECQHQFRWHRWNCSSLLGKSSNPHASGIMKRGSAHTGRRIPVAVEINGRLACHHASRGSLRAVDLAEETTNNISGPGAPRPAPPDFTLRCGSTHPAPRARRSPPPLLLNQLIS